MDVDDHADAAVAKIASAIGEPARARMLYSLMDSHARTSTELAVIAGVSPATASVHLSKLKTEHLVKVHIQGKHRYYSLDGREVAAVLEGLSVLSGSRSKFVPKTPSRLRAARTCYDHMAGTLGVSLNDCLKKLEWLSEQEVDGNSCYNLTPQGAEALSRLGIDVERTRTLRRRFAFACLDWSERRSHIGGALGAALLELALKKRWVTQDIDIRALYITSLGKREMLARFGLSI